MTTTYEVVGGTPATNAGPHEARTIRRATTNEGLVQMMSEIADGVFVAWADCTTCHQHVAYCRCTDGPVEPVYVTRWREARFAQSLDPSRQDPKQFVVDRSKPLRRVPDPFHVPEPVDQVEEKVDDGLDKALAAVAGVDGKTD